MPSGFSKASAGLLARFRAELKPLGGTENLGCARVDHAREARKGYPEVVFGEGKTREQIAAISVRILARSGRLLVTRASEDVYRFLLPRIPGLRYNASARAIFHEGTSKLRAAHRLVRGHVLVIC